MLIGIFALQGGVAEHAAIVEQLGAQARWARKVKDFDGLDALILPGGESTAMNKLIDTFGLRERLARAVAEIPTLGTCAGLILLSQLGALDVDVERNAFGSQVDSASIDLAWDGKPMRAALIRAPKVTRIGPGVEVCSRLEGGEIVGVRSGKKIGISFHPELTGDTTVHDELLGRFTSG
ncbi:glutamine amidotransferase [Trueperella pyogenes]|uniref:pyridoxal 5'-phosphate synthase glutaminase subunit PdxT n=1 Tax=Trueperella pyogenes TaxID=1661 RepID=UPI00043AE6EA|nr:pyridoxal 5'-phosphate synthase glutaminase subunit PdxT [Trueperella pyogenes]AHU89141.1 glutamine amidotransferase [Trueperella pyogenes]OQD38723.1 glutamine amidotransferase subunit PdxT [Trueperella pyogenes]